MRLPGESDNDADGDDRPDPVVIEVARMRGRVQFRLAPRMMAARDSSGPSIVQVETFSRRHPSLRAMGNLLAPPSS